MGAAGAADSIFFSSQKRMTPTKTAYIIALILALVALRGLIYGLVIPFDQAPDEKHHFELVKAKELQLRQADDAEIARTAAAFQKTWLLLLSPDRPENQFTDADFADARLPRPPASADVYYLSMAWLLKLLNLQSLSAEIYALRGVSTLCGLVVVGMAFLIAQTLFPQAPFSCLGVPLFITFIPQFAAMNGAINNDKFAEVWIAVFLWLLVKMFKHGVRASYLSAELMVLGLAICSKRTSYFLIPLFGLMLFVYVWKASLGLKMHLVLAVGLLGVALVTYLLLWHPAFHQFVKSKLWIPPAREIHHLIFRAELISPAFLKYYAKFATVMYWSFWGVFGYMTIHLHHFWYVAAAIFQGLAVLGLAKMVRQVKQQTLKLAAWQAKTLYLYGASIVLIVALMFFRSILFKMNEPFYEQGRHLFTVVIPIGVLTILGLERLFAPVSRRWVGGLGLLGLILLDVVCLSNYILLNFHARALF